MCHLTWGHILRNVLLGVPLLCEYHSVLTQTEIATMISGNIILWDHHCKCGPLLTFSHAEHDYSSVWNSTQNRRLWHYGEEWVGSGRKARERDT